MPRAYLIGEIDVQDPETYSKYTSKTPEVIMQHGGRFIVRGGTVDPREGDAPLGRVVVIEFPSLDAARGFYESEAYRALIPVRQAASKGRFFLVEGTAEGS